MHLFALDGWLMETFLDYYWSVFLYVLFSNSLLTVSLYIGIDMLDNAVPSQTQWNNV